MKTGPGLASAIVLSLAVGFAPTSVSDDSSDDGAVTILMAGDLMVGRRVAETADSFTLFEDVKYIVGRADVAMANLESPLTLRPHSSKNPYALEADPAMASVIATAGFDALSIANNHAGDAGPASVTDTVDAVHGAGMLAVGGGGSTDEAWSHRTVEANGVTVALLAFDVSRQGLAAGDGPGIASWDPGRAEQVVREAREAAAVVIVSIHGGIEEWPGTDPLLDPVARELVSWGADVVWGHGPHVAQPIVTLDAPDGRTALIATSLGNFLFDQQVPPNSEGRVLEVMVDRFGLEAWRVGVTRNDDLRAHFEEWLAPHGDAALLGGDWWATVGTVDPAAAPAIDIEFPHGDVMAAAAGDMTGDGTHELLVAYRHPYRAAAWDPRPLPVDALGRSAHVGVFASDTTPLWMSRRPPAPIGDVGACDGGAAFAYTSLDDPAVVATGAGVWNGFGFTLPPALPGVGTPGCADIDGDGLLDPVILDRTG